MEKSRRIVKDFLNELIPTDEKKEGLIESAFDAVYDKYNLKELKEKEDMPKTATKRKPRAKKKGTQDEAPLRIPENDKSVFRKMKIDLSGNNRVLVFEDDIAKINYFRERLGDQRVFATMSIDLIKEQYERAGHNRVFDFIFLGHDVVPEDYLDREFPNKNYDGSGTVLMKWMHKSGMDGTNTIFHSDNILRGKIAKKTLLPNMVILPFEFIQLKKIPDLPQEMAGTIVSGITVSTYQQQVKALDKINC